MSPQSPGFDTYTFAQKVLITAGIVIPILLIIWFLGSIFELLLLILAATLVHAFFLSFAQFIQRKTSIPRGWAKAASVIIVLGVIVLVCWLLEPNVVSQTRQLITQLQHSIKGFNSFLSQYWWGDFLLSQIPDNLDRWMQNHSYFIDFFSSALGVIIKISIILLLAAYFLMNPRPYAHGIVKLFPKKKRSRIQQTINKVYLTLQLWLEGKLLTMLFVAVLTTIGLYILGFPLALVLGIIAGVLGFIPNFGPILAAIPAVLIAFTEGGNAILYVIILYTGVQVCENTFFQPLIEKKMIYLPFAMVLLAQIAFGLLLGLLGVLLATPFVAAIIIAVKMLYVQDVLDDEEAAIGY